MPLAKLKVLLPLKLPFYILLSLLIIVPLIFTNSIDNGFELTKAVSLKLMGGLFVLFVLAVHLISGSRRKISGSFFTADKTFDPYVLLFVFAAILSAVFSVNPYTSIFGSYDRQIGLVLYLYLFFIYYFSSAILSTPEKISAAIRVMESSAVIAGVYSILQFFKMDPFNIPIQHNRISSTFSNSIFTGGFMTLVYPLSLYEVFKSKNKLTRLIPAAIIIVSVVISQSRGAYVALIIETIIIIFCYPLVFRSDSAKFKRLLKYFLFSFVIVLLTFVFMVLFVHSNPFINRLASIPGITNSARWLLWRDSLKAFLLYPISGSGISAFSNVFENVISPELRHYEVNRYYDNTHNNYLQVLCTMGLIGAISYLLLIVQSVRISLKAFLDKSLTGNHRLFSLAVFASLAGYIIFGIADFDDVSILLYLFIILALLRSMYRISFPVKEKTIDVNQKAVILFTGIFIIFSIYISYRAVNEYRADSYYLTGRNLFTSGNFNESVKALNNAVILNDGCPEYKYTLASYVYSYCANNTAMNPKTKSSLLEQAKNELEKTKNNIHSLQHYKSLLAVILLEQGKTAEGMKLTDEVFSIDSLALSLRNNLARYYMGKGEYDKMFNELNFILKYDPESIDCKKTYLIYYMKINDTANALIYAEQLLGIEPGNELMQKLYDDLKKRQSLPGSK